MTNTQFLMKSQQTANKTSTVFLKGEWRRWQSYLKHCHIMTSGDASRARRLYRALWNFWWKWLRTNLIHNNKFIHKILFKNQSHPTHNPKDRNPSLTTQTYRQLAISCYTPLTTQTYRQLAASCYTPLTTQTYRQLAASCYTPLTTQTYRELAASCYTPLTTQTYRQLAASCYTPLTTQTYRQLAASCYTPGTVSCMSDVLFFLTLHNHVTHQQCNSTPTTHHSSGRLILLTSKMTQVQSLIDCTICGSHSIVNAQHIPVLRHVTLRPLVHRYHVNAQHIPVLRHVTLRPLVHRYQWFKRL